MLLPAEIKMYLLSLGVVPTIGRTRNTQPDFYLNSWIKPQVRGGVTKSHHFRRSERTFSKIAKISKIFETKPFHRTPQARPQVGPSWLCARCNLAIDNQTHPRQTHA